MPARQSRRHSHLDTDLLRAVVSKMTAHDTAEFDRLMEKAERAQQQARAESEAVEQQRQKALREIEQGHEELEARKARFKDFLDASVQDLQARLGGEAA